MTILYDLLVLLVAVLVTTITSLYDLTISLFNSQSTWNCREVSKVVITAQGQIGPFIEGFEETNSNSHSLR